MAVGGLFRYARETFFSKPTPEKQLLRLVKPTPVRRVVEVGIGSFAITQALLASVVKQAGGEPVHYTALDEFDQRPAGAAPLSLRDAYRRLSQKGVRLRLVPGDPIASLVGESNSLENTDLLLLTSDATDLRLAAAWYFVPRMCHPGTQIVRQTASSDAEAAGAWEVVPLSTVARLAARPTRLAA
ncbi:hypothetical protein [Botrimarina sp.]|uniref:hypothetical protein n=1 Tax=Botrimarina sp. TaxID=2795802 RepID=UPI0032EC25D5